MTCAPGVTIKTGSIPEDDYKIQFYIRKIKDSKRDRDHITESSRIQSPNAGLYGGEIVV